MKTDNRYQMETSSTQEREKRFSRRSMAKNSRSRSNNSDSNSISKFFVKNVERPQKAKNYNELMKQSINGNPQWTPPKRDPTPYKTIREKKLKLTKQQLLQQQSKDLVNLRNQIEKYRSHHQRQSKENQGLLKQNAKLKEKIIALQTEVETEKKMRFSLEISMNQMANKLSHTQKMISYWQKEQNPLKKVKNSIFQSRIQQFEKEREELNLRIKQLEEALEQSRTMNGSFSIKSSFIMDSQAEILMPIKTFEDQYIKDLENQLFKAREDIKSLHIHINCQQRKFYKQMTVFKQSKEKDYKELKDKFAQFLTKYKEMIKKFTTNQVKNLLEKKKTQKQIREKQSDSLLISSDEEPII